MYFKDPARSGLINPGGSIDCVSSPEDLAALEERMKAAAAKPQPLRPSHTAAPVARKRPPSW